jgi:hypothetical protein
MGRGANGCQFAKILAEVIQELLLCSHFVPLTTEYLNKGSAAPRKNNQTNRYSMCYGILYIVCLFVLS